MPRIVTAPLPPRERPAAGDDSPTRSHNDRPVVDGSTGAGRRFIDDWCAPAPLDALRGVGLTGTTTELPSATVSVTVRKLQLSPSSHARRVRPGDTVEDWAWAGEFDRFVTDARPRLTRAFVGSVGVSDAADAAAEALAYAFEHWDRVRAMDNPAGYLYRVGRSRIRHRKTPSLPAPVALGMPDIEPTLIPALVALPESQRTAVWLVHACQWHYSEVAEAMHTSVSMVGNHVSRGMANLRHRLGVTGDA